MGQLGVLYLINLNKITQMHYHFQGELHVFLHARRCGHVLTAEACTQCELIQHSRFTYNDAAITKNISTCFGRVDSWFFYMMQFQF